MSPAKPKQKFVNTLRIETMRIALNAMMQYRDTCARGSVMRRDADKVIKDQRQLLRDELFGWYDEPASKYRKPKH